MLPAEPAIGQPKQDHTNYDEAKAGGYDLPPLLTTRAGKPVRTAAEWNRRRRPEILALYRDHVHGHTPAKLPKDLSFTVVEEDPKALGGTAHRKQMEIRFSKQPDAPVVHLLLYTPAAAKGPVPVFLALHFNGNWAIVDDPGRPPVRDLGPQDARSGRCPPADVKRGTSKEWDVPLVLARGYGVAAIHYGDIEPDFEGGAGRPFGVRTLYRKPGQTERGAEGLGGHRRLGLGHEPRAGLPAEGQAGRRQEGDRRRAVAAGQDRAVGGRRRTSASPW